MKSILSVLMALGFMSFSFYGEDDVKPKEIRQNDEVIKLFKEIVSAASDFLKKNSSEKDDKAWKSRFEKRIADAVYDDGIDENQFCDNWVQDWLMYRRFYTEKDITKTDKIQACRILLFYVDKNLHIPEYLVKNITTKNVQEAKRILETEQKTEEKK